MRNFVVALCSIDAPAEQLHVGAKKSMGKMKIALTMLPKPWLFRMSLEEECTKSDARPGIHEEECTKYIAKSGDFEDERTLKTL